MLLTYVSKRSGPIIFWVWQIVMKKYLGEYLDDFYLNDFRKKNTKKILSAETRGIQNTVLDECTESLVYLEGFQNEAEFEQLIMFYVAGLN